jgi:flagellar hook-associated protein 1 FlgK
MSNLSLEIGKRALLANKLALDVTSNNIGNANTVGYTRREVSFSETDPLYNRKNFLGTGLELDKFRSFREEFFDRELRNTAGRKEGFSLDELVYQKIETFLAEPTDNGLNETISNFFNSIEEMNNSPENIGIRDNFLSKAQILIDRFHAIGNQFEDLRKDTATKVNQNVDKANSLIEEISNINSKIAMGRTLANSDVQTLDNQRSLRLGDLAKVTSIQVTQGDFGSLNVSVNGINVVTGSSSTKLKSQESIDQVTGEKTLNIYNIDNNGNVLNKVQPTSGELSAQLKHYNVTLDNKDSSGGFSIYNKIDSFAGTLIKKVNSVAVQGFGLDDKGNTPPGRSIFEPSVGDGTALSIHLSSDIFDKPKNIPLSTMPSEPGNNEIGRKLANIQNDGTFLESMTPAAYYGTLMGRVGTMGQEAKTGISTTQLVYDQLNNQRNSAVGVNLDEEAISLIKFQKAFEASSRIINITNEMMNTVLNLGR